MSTTASLIMIPAGFKATKLYSIIPNTGAGDFTAARSTTATRINPSGLIETSAIDVPRLGYGNVPILNLGTINACPDLLIEPQSTNLLLRSEELDNASWTKTRGSITVNDITSPGGTTTADKLVEDSTASSTHFVTQNAGTVGVNSTLSVFAKADERNFIYLQLGASLTAYFDVLNGTVGTVAGGAITKIESFKNGWFRCSISGVILTNNSNLLHLADSDGGITYSGDGVSGLHIWGAQTEALSYNTSYITTLGVTVTRTEDTCNITSASGLIGQDSGYMFTYFKREGNEVSRGGVLYLRQAFLRGLSINYENDKLNFISRNNAGSSTVIVKAVFLINETVKVAINYNNNGGVAGGSGLFDAYVNGVKVITAGLYKIPDIDLNETRIGYGSNSGTDTEVTLNSIKEVSIGKTNLTSSQAITLTTL